MCLPVRMGAWGTALFSNDTSSDVREEFRDLIGDGVSAEEATEQLVASYGVSLPPDADPDVSVDFWLALAVTQHKLGRLLPGVREAAIAATGDPRELARWEPRDRRKRQAALDKAVQLLQLPQSAPKKVPRRIRCETSLEPGQHVLYELASGSRIMLRVLSIHEDKGGRGPRVALLDWSPNDALPKDPAALTVRADPQARRPGEGMGFLLFGAPGDPGDRLELVPSTRRRTLIGRSAPPRSDQERISQWVCRWRDLERWFEDDGTLRRPTAH
jgi:hypothetical protein